MISEVITEQLLSYPCVDLQERARLPTIKAVYIVHTEEQVIYVGASTDLRLRISNHTYLNKFLRFEKVKVSWIPCDEDMLYEIESEYIESLKPLFNLKDAYGRNLKVSKKKHIVAYLDEHVWQAFRVACLQHGISASKQVETLLREQMSQWESVTSNGKARTRKVKGVKA